MNAAHHDKSPSQDGEKIRKEGLSRLDWRDPYLLAVTCSWPMFFLYMFAGQILLNLLFAIGFALAPGSITNARPGSLLDAFFFSMELATVGYGAMSPATTFGHVLSTIEILVGTAYTSVVTGLIFVRFSRPKSKLLFADQAVIGRHDGQPTLMIRVANGRKAPLINAQAQVTILLEEITAEGKPYRRTLDVPLVRPQFPMFPLTWTLLHRIDEISPLAGLDATLLQTRQARLMVNLNARSPELSTDLFATHVYGAGSILFGHQYADMVFWDRDGNVHMKLSDLSLTEADPAAAPSSST